MVGDEAVEQVRERSEGYLISLGAVQVAVIDGLPVGRVSERRCEGVGRFEWRVCRLLWRRCWWLCAHTGYLTRDNQRARWYLQLRGFSVAAVAGCLLICRKSDTPRLQAPTASASVRLLTKNAEPGTRIRLVTHHILNTTICIPSLFY